MTATHHGKQIFLAGRHIADAVDEASAELIVQAFADRESIAAYLDAESKVKRRSMRFRRLLSVLADNVRGRVD